MSPELLSGLSLRHAGAPIANAVATDDAGPVIDLSTFEGCMFVATVTDSASGGVASIAVEQGDAADLSDAVAIPDATASGTSAAADDLNGRLLVVDVYRPTGRYLRLRRTSATANIAFGSAVVALYGARREPVEAHATVIAQTAVASHGRVS